MKHWLSYGGGVNSTALAVVLAQGKVFYAHDWECIFADTGNEKEGTSRYSDHFAPWLRTKGKTMHTVNPVTGMTVLEYWEKNEMTGSRLMRACTRLAKSEPIDKFVQKHGGGIQLIGIDADEECAEPHALRLEKIVGFCGFSGSEKAVAFGSLKKRWNAGLRQNGPKQMRLCAKALWGRLKNV